MKSLPAFLKASSDGARAVFRGGSAPAEWRRGLDRAAQGRHRLRRGTAWVRGFDDIDGKLLRSDPFGKALAQLVAQPAAEAEQWPAYGSRPRSGLTRPVRPPEQGKAEHAYGRSTESVRRPSAEQHQATDIKRAAKEDSKRHTTDAADRIRSRIDRSVLERLAGRQSASEGARVGRQPSPSIKSGPEFEKSGRSRTSAPEIPISAGTGETPVPALSLDISAYRRWLERRVRRIETVVTRSLPENGRLTQATEQPAHGGEPIHRLSETLSEQWRLPLSGKFASAELLARWVREKTGTVDADNGVASRSASNKKPVSSSLRKRDAFDLHGALDEYFRTDSRLSHPSYGKRVKEAGGSNDVYAPDRKATRPDAVQTNNASTTTERPPGEQAGKGENKTKIAEVATPTDVSSALSELSFPHNADAKNRPPVTANTGLKGFEQAEDDLDALADKIKRILDEQARRNGIDV
ncbi:MAG: hypothetical protein ACU84J_06045 [Gammaproteobacteria bacterium]